MEISEKVRSKHLVKANEILDGLGQLTAQTLLIGHKKFVFAPERTAILVGSLVTAVCALVVFKAYIFGVMLFPVSIVTFLQTSKPGRSVGITDHGFVWFSGSRWTAKPNKIIGTDTVMPFSVPAEARLCGETVVFARSEVRHGRLQQRRIAPQ